MTKMWEERKKGSAKKKGGRTNEKALESCHSLSLFLFSIECVVLMVVKVLYSVVVDDAVAYFSPRSIA
jgi:hypothetical protein